MNHLIVPSQVSWHLAWSDMFDLFQTLHTAICAKDKIQRVIFAGSNATVCQNLKRVWQQFLEEFVNEVGVDTEVDLIPTDSAIAPHPHYIHPAHYTHADYPDISQLTQYQITLHLPLPQIESGVLMVTKRFSVWVQLQSVSSPEVPLASTSPTPFKADLATRWYATLVLEQSHIREVFQTVEGKAIADSISPVSACEQEHQAVQSFWHYFLQLTQGITPETDSEKTPQPLPCLFKPMFQQIPLGIFQAHLDGSFVSMNPAFCQLTGYRETELIRLDMQSITAEEDARTELEMIQQIVQYQEQRIFEKRYRRPDGGLVWAEVKLSLVGKLEDEDGFLMGFVTDLSDRRQIEAERLQAFQEIQQRQEQATLLNNIAVRIRSAMDLPTILQNAVEELNRALHSDRVVIYQFTDGGGGCCVSESVHPSCVSMQGQTFGIDCISRPYLEGYRSGRLWSADDVSCGNLAACHLQMLQQVQVKSIMVTGILSTDDGLQPNQRQLWGLLEIHQCQSQRGWTSNDRQLVESVANQLAIALEQTKLLNQLTQ